MDNKTIEMSEEDFDRVLVKPICGAYRNNGFLDESMERNSREVWYNILKYTSTYELQSKVEHWITHNSKLPVLADISNGLKLYARFDEQDKGFDEV